jgi:hypothetical protein
MKITNTAGCPVASCPQDLGPDCQHPCSSTSAVIDVTTEYLTGPEALKGPFDPSGFPVG